MKVLRRVVQKVLILRDDQGVVITKNCYDVVRGVFVLQDSSFFKGSPKL